MATPLRAVALLAALRAEGVNVIEHAGWRTNERDDETGKAFGPVHGVLIHHTAGTSSLGIVFGGRAGLPGPLAHAHLAKSGLCTLVSAGRANHAGLVAVNAYEAVLAEAAVHPAPLKASGTVDGNDVLYGIEIENLGDGRDPYPVVQYDQAVRWAVALCRAHGWSADSVVGHKETSVEGKIDPSFSMTKFRTDVTARLAHTPGWNPNEEDDVALTTEDINKVALATANKLIAGDGVLENSDVARVAAAVAAKLQPVEAAQSATIDKLVGAVATLAANIGDLDPAAIVAELKASIESITIHLDVPEA